MKVKDEAEKDYNKAKDEVLPVAMKVKDGALWAYCHAKPVVMNQVHDWEDDWTHNAAILSSGCGKGGDFTECINAISETKNTEIIHGVPISYGDILTYASNALLPGSGSILKAASTGIDATAAVSSIVDPHTLLMELHEADC